MPEREVESSELRKQPNVSEFPGSSRNWLNCGSVAETFFKAQLNIHMPHNSRAYHSKLNFK